MNLIVFHKSEYLIIMSLLSHKGVLLIYCEFCITRFNKKMNFYLLKKYNFLTRKKYLTDELIV